MRIAASLFTALLLAGCSTVGGSTPNLAQDDSSSSGAPSQAAPAPKDDSLTDSGEADMLADASGPLAFGVVALNGAKLSGTPNWSSTYNAGLKRYEITITGQSYFYLNYSTLVTPTGDTRFCRTDSVSGKLLVYCFDKAGAVQQSRFGFTTFKP